MSQLDGDNSIIISGGANMAFKEGDELSVEWTDIIMKSDVLLLQREVPEFVNVLAVRAANKAKEAGSKMKVILDTGGRDDDNFSSEVIKGCDIISPNTVSNP